MAINLFNKYGSRANPPSIDYPQGSVKNRSAPDVKDGTPLDADWANDHQGFFQSILSYFGVTANGTPDKVGASQYFDALMSDPSETLRGIPLVATQTEVDAGKNDEKIVTSEKLRFGVQAVFNVNAGFIAMPSWLFGFVIQWGVGIIPDGVRDATISWPVAFPNAQPMSCIVTDGGSVAVSYGISSMTATNFIVHKLPSFSSLASFRFIAIGR